MDSSDLQKMGRRRFMENLAGIGVSAATVQNISQEELAQLTEDPEEEIPYIARWENVGRAEDGTVHREPVYDTISRGKHERKEATDEALRRIGSILDGSELDDFSLVLTTAEHSPTEYGVEVRTSPEERQALEELVPTELDGNGPRPDARVPVDVRGGMATKHLEEEEDSYGGKLWEEIGGAAPVVEITSEDGGAGTTTGAFHSNTHGDGWVTAGHIANGNGNQVLLEIDNNGIDTKSMGFPKLMQNTA